MADRGPLAVPDPQELQDKWDYPQLTEKSRRRILGLNSAVLYGLKGAQQKPRGYGAVPPNYASLVPDSLRNLLTGVGLSDPGNAGQSHS